MDTWKEVIQNFLKMTDFDVYGNKTGETKEWIYLDWQKTFELIEGNLKDLESPLN